MQVVLGVELWRRHIQLQALLHQSPFFVSILKGEIKLTGRVQEINGADENARMVTVFVELESVADALYLMAHFGQRPLM